MKEELINIKSYRQIAVSFIKPQMNYLIVLAHGFLSHKDSHLIRSLAELLYKRGFGVARFNFNSYITLENWFLDLSSVINYFKDDYKIILMGHSLGGLIALMSYEDVVDAIIALAPVSRPKKPSFLNSEDVKEQFENEDIIEIKKGDITYRVSKSYILERLSLNFDKVFENVKCPVLLLHGSEDKIIGIEDSRNAIKKLPMYSKLIVLEGADHNFKGFERLIVDFSMQWLNHIIF